ncbi:hypothetical protein E2562_032601 [Oryza meyeriana var. granulata]|uniref:Uncharacterized protein n=1 Tax=Oryza meyeriana var. granulata TaxID=110450 RepID=A0A6G1EC43_9ORYZ|nr:hypothetical protein E2562_032601 [Oryza meyeriana var. granulata]
MQRGCGYLARRRHLAELLGRDGNAMAQRTVLRHGKTGLRCAKKRGGDRVRRCTKPGDGMCGSCILGGSPREDGDGTVLAEFLGLNARGRLGLDWLQIELMVDDEY